MNKNHAIRTRRKTATHYQVVKVNIQSGRVLNVLGDAVKDSDMSQTEYESYVEGMYQAFVKFDRDSDVATGILRNEFY